jgi:AraC family transcriptional regulator
MLNGSPSFGVTTSGHLGARSQPICPKVPPLPRSALPADGDTVGPTQSEQSVRISLPTVDVVPQLAVARRGMEWHGLGAELVQTTTQRRVDYRFCSQRHLLVAYHRGVRREGESCIEGISRSTLRDFGHKLSLVPEGREYHEWHDLRTAMAATYFYFHPETGHIYPEGLLADVTLAPRMFFEDPTIWSTITKLTRAIETPPQDASRLYVEALGVVLVHELVRLNRGTRCADAAVKGGLAAWQQRIVVEYVEEHLSEQIPLAALARLARLSTFHFCRAFKQSFGVPPHRYHTYRRIEKAKAMLAENKHSVTEIGSSVGFSETSSFTAVFRKITGQTPNRYHRANG